jgi:chromosome segregation ATPase
VSASASDPSSSRTAAAATAKRRRSDAAVQRVRDAIAAIAREKARVAVAAVARRANVSRTFIYDNPQARAVVAAALTDADHQPQQLRPAGDDGQQALWRERALNAEDALKTAHAEISRQRARIGELLGQIRDLQAEWDEQSIARITTENTTLKQRVRQLTADNRTLEERLTAARSTLRFQDRRVADLEGRIADQAVTT